MKFLKIGKDYIKIHEMNNFYKKFKGLMFKKEPIKDAYLFENVNSIHMFFMFQEIDVVMTDKNYKVLYKFENLKPWRIILPKKGVFYTFELPKSISKSIFLNEILTLEEK